MQLSYMVLKQHCRAYVHHWVHNALFIATHNLHTAIRYTREAERLNTSAMQCTVLPSTIYITVLSNYNNKLEHSLHHTTTLQYTHYKESS
jgi:hypothetical protein